MNSRILEFETKMYCTILNFLEENGRRLNIDSIDFIEYLSVLV